MMEPCKRMTVKATGYDVQDGILVHVTATNGNLMEEGCRNIPGACGCEHAEINVLKEMPNPTSMAVSHSPCLNCAKALVKAGVKLVTYVEEYRIRDGIDYLKNNGVHVIHTKDMLGDERNAEI